MEGLADTTSFPQTVTGSERVNIVPSMPLSPN